MYVTQTYLGFEAKKAKAYVYFLSETYMTENQRNLHDVFINRAKQLGLSTDENVAVLLPVAGYEDKVVRDLADQPDSPVQKFYKKNIQGKTPGLLVSSAPIDTKRGISKAVFFTFQTTEHPFNAAKNLITAIINEPEDSLFIRTLTSINEIAILNPNFYGMGINLNAVIKAYLEKK